MTLLLCGLVGFTWAQIFKMAVGVKTGRSPWVKVGLAAMGSVAVAEWMFRHNTQDIIIYSVAGLGLAMLIHKLYRFLMAGGDWFITDILSRRSRR